MQILADVLQKPVRLLANPYGSCIGAAWVAAIGSGQDVGWNDVQRLSGLGATVEPDTPNADVYDRGYADFRKLYEVLKPMFHASGGS